MPPKKKACNPFYFYMLDMKQQYEKAARRTLSMEEVVKRAHPNFQKLSPEEKEKYVLLAAKLKNNPKNKFTNAGVSYHDKDTAEQAIDRGKQSMKRHIENTVRSSSIKDLLKKPFYFIHFNYYCKEDEGIYTPCEFAVARYSIADGIHDSIYDFIKPETIPVGYAYQAKSRSEMFHQIPLPVPSPENEHSDKYLPIISLILRFLSNAQFTTNEYPPLFCPLQAIPVVQGCINWLMERQGVDIQLNVFELAKLFQELNNATTDNPEYKYQFLCMAEFPLEEDVFNYAKNLSCYFHENDDTVMNPHECSLSYVRRWGFIISDKLCVNLCIEPRPGFHCPEMGNMEEHRILLEKSKRYEVVPTQEEIHMLQVKKREQRAPAANQAYAVPEAAAEPQQESDEEDDSADKASAVSDGCFDVLDDLEEDDVPLSIGRGRPSRESYAPFKY